MRGPASPSRRDLLAGRFLPELHISSLVVHVRPERVANAHRELASLRGLEIHAESGGKFVVTLETFDEADIIARLDEISRLPGVLSAALVYHHFEAADGTPTPGEGEP